MPRDLVFPLLGALHLPPSPSALFLPRVGPPCAGLFLRPKSYSPSESGSKASLRCEGLPPSFKSSLMTLEAGSFERRRRALTAETSSPAIAEQSCACRVYGVRRARFLPPSPRRAVLPRVGPSRRGVFRLARAEAGSFRPGAGLHIAALSGPQAKPSEGGQRAADHSSSLRTQSTSTSTSHFGSMNRATPTKVQAGRMSPKNSP